MAISEATKALFDQHTKTFTIYSLATASKSGVPNVVPIGFLWIANDDEIWVVDNFLNKTLANIKENPVAAVYARAAEGPQCVQVKGKCVYETSGKDYEAAKAMAKSKSDKYPAKGLLKIKVSCEFETTPGPNAGNKL